MIPSIFTTEKGFAFDASTLTGAAGDPVSILSDLSPNGYDLAQSNTANQPTIGITSGKKSVVFNNTNDFLSKATVDLSGATAFTLIVAMKYNGSATDVIIEHGTSPLNGGFGMFSNNGSAAPGAGIGVNGSTYLFKNAPTSPNLVGQYIVATSVLDTAATNKIDMRINGADVTDVAIAASGTVSASAFASRTLYMGARAGGSLFADCEVFGVIGIARLLTSTELAACEAWAAALMSGSSAPLLSNVRRNHAFKNTSYQTQKTNYIETTPFAEVSFDTTAVSIEVDTYSNIYSNYPTMASVAVYVNGTFLQDIQHAANGAKTTAITLASGSKTVRFVNGAQSKPSTDLLGTFLCDVRSDAPMATHSGDAKLVIYGDSIAVGANATDTQTQGWPMLVRAAVGATAVEAYGYRCLSNDGAADIRYFADKIAAMAPSAIWIAIGTNDYALATQTAAAFGTMYGQLVDTLHALRPDAVIYAQSPIVRSSESGLAAYRSAISALTATRSWLNYIDGSTILTTSDLSDGVHPTTAGHDKYADYVIDVLT